MSTTQESFQFMAIGVLTSGNNGNKAIIELKMKSDDVLERPWMLIYATEMILNGLAQPLYTGFRNGNYGQHLMSR
jgi:hypothetical protein